MKMILAMVVMAVACITCLMLGVKIGQSAAKGEEIEFSIPNPVEYWQEHHQQKEAQKEAQREAEKVNAILSNIDSYDGTGANQQDVPR
jgi:thiaminase